MSQGAVERVHASTVALDGVAIVIRGGPASGKSDLALRLIDAGAMLIADDQTIIERRGDSVEASAPDPIRGRLEVRGLGIVAMDAGGPTRVGLVVDLVPGDAIARMPEDHELATELLGLHVPRIAVDPALPGAVARVRVALAHLRRTSGASALVSPPEQ